MESIAKIAAAHSWPISVDFYHRLIDKGVLSERDRVELIEGVIVAVSPQSPEHAYVVSRLSALLSRALSRDWSIRPQMPMTLPASEPEPDIVVCAAELEDGAVRHPTTATLVVEVAKTSIVLDRAMAPVYARAGVGEYWIIDVDQRQIEVHADLRDGAYRTLRTATAADTLTPAGLDVAVPVAALFRPARP